MTETGVVSAKIGAIRLLPLALMATNRALRQRVRVLVKHGVSQKMLAAKMGVSESWLSRWLQAPDTATSPVLTVDAMDRLRDFERELGNLLLQGGPPDAAGPRFPNAAEGEAHAEAVNAVGERKP